MWPHTGSWGLPDFGFTELLQRTLQPGNPLTADNGSNLFGAPPPTRTYTQPTTRSVTTTPDLYGGDAGGVSRANGGGVAPVAADPGVDLARQAYEQRIKAIQNLFGQTKQRAADVRGEADRTFDNLLKSVGAFRDRSKNLFDTAGQEITDTASGILGGNARTAREQEGDLRAKGRALGLGDSSKFKQQTGLAGRLAATQGNTLATRGTQNRQNRNLFDERQDQAQDQENQAGSYKTGLYDEARRLENTGLDQFGDNLDAASNTLGSSLNNILNYQRQLAAINPLQAGGINAYTPDFSNVQNAVSEIVGAPMAGGAGKGFAADTGANPVNPTNILELIRRNKGLYNTA
jgi:hypothetical protein